MSHAEPQPSIIFFFSFHWIGWLILLAHKVSENSECSFSELKVPRSNRLFLSNQKSENTQGCGYEVKIGGDGSPRGPTHSLEKKS